VAGEIEHGVVGQDYLGEVRGADLVVRLELGGGWGGQEPGWGGEEGGEGLGYVGEGSTEATLVATVFAEGFVTDGKLGGEWNGEI
jgi:hypothetical protein